MCLLEDPKDGMHGEHKCGNAAIRACCANLMPGSQCSVCFRFNMEGFSLRELMRDMPGLGNREAEGSPGM